MPTKFVITGFGHFAGVHSNPTQHLVEWLAAKQQEQDKHRVSCTALTNPCSQVGGSAANEASTLLSHQPKTTSTSKAAGYEIVSCQVLEVSGQAVSRFLDEQQAMLQHACRGQNDPLVLLHLGVDTEGTCLKLESRAFNNAHFRCPDQAGWQPSNTLIEQNEGFNLHSTRICSLPLQDIASRIRAAGFDCQVSHDAGRFVCNYTYYKSLCLAASVSSAVQGTNGLGVIQAAASGADGGEAGQSAGSSSSCSTTAGQLDDSLHSSMQQQQRQNRQMTRSKEAHVDECSIYSCYSLFVHVPPFTVVPDTQQQEFLLMLLQCIDAVLHGNQPSSQA